MENLAERRSRMLAMVMQNVDLHYGWDGVRKMLTDFDADEAMDIVILCFGTHHPYVERTAELF